MNQNRTRSRIACFGFSSVVGGENAARLEHKPCDSSANERGYDKQPHLPQRGRLCAHANTRGSERARRVDRNARHIDADNVYRDQRQTDGEAGELGRTGFLRYAENADQEEKGCNDLEDESRKQIVLTKVTRPPAVLSETTKGLSQTAILPRS
jgi:hypothetical protein